MKYIVTDQVVLSRAPEGPLAGQIAAFSDWTREQGYTLGTLRYRVRIAASFSEWLAKNGVRLRSIGARHCAKYLRSRARRRRVRKADAPTLRHLLAFLRHGDVIACDRLRRPRPSPVEQCVQAFERYLREDRALARATIINYLPFIREFIKLRFGNRPVKLENLCARDVVRFVQRRVSHLHLRRAKTLTTALRSFLQYARYRGYIQLDLAMAVPRVANWSMPAIPRAIAPDQVRKLLRQIDRTTVMGRRDYAILLLLARLGLRSSEVASLRLEDINWSDGCLNVHGKNGRQLQVPLPADVGEAIVAYLQDGRPRSTCRCVFLRSKAPIRGFLTTGGIGTIVRHAILRTGIDAPTRGAHQFRHGLASEMLRHGASLSEIGQLLGHRSPETTKIYTKVDLGALRTLTLPWLGGVR